MCVTAQEIESVDKVFGMVCRGLEVSPQVFKVCRQLIACEKMATAFASLTNTHSPVRLLSMWSYIIIKLFDLEQCLKALGFCVLQSSTLFFRPDDDPVVQGLCKGLDYVDFIV